MQLIPAYGRDYKSKKEVMVDWDAGKDFQVADLFHNGYINKSDFEADTKLRYVNIRYKKLTQVCVVMKKGR